MKLTIIVAKSTNGVIGNKGKLPWDLPADLQHFKRTTMNKPIIMGRKTYESIGRPLPGRLNIVVTKSQDEFAGVTKARSLPEAIEIASRTDDEAFIIGGAALYQMALPWAMTMVITEVLEDTEGDTYFPRYNENNWEVIRRHAPFTDNGRLCTVQWLERIKDDLHPVVHGTGKFTDSDVFNFQMSIQMSQANARTSKRRAAQQTNKEQT